MKVRNKRNNMNTLLSGDLRAIGQRMCLQCRCALGVLLPLYDDCDG